MSGEKYQYDEVSTNLIEDLFAKLNTHTIKEFGSGWERRRLQNVFAKKAINLYIQPAAERLISEYLQADIDSSKSEEELDTEMTFEKRIETRDIEVSFEASRYPAEENDTEISTIYKVEFSSTVPIDDIIDIPVIVRDQVVKELSDSETRHLQNSKKEPAAGKDREDFDGSLAINKRHTFVLKEMQESLSYNIEHSYEGIDFSVPILTYKPSDEPSTPLFLVTSTATTEHIADQRERHNTLALFEEMMKYQNIEKPVAKRPAEVRVAQILAILALLQFGEAQNEEQEAIIKDLT